MHDPDPARHGHGSDAHPADPARGLAAKVDRAFWDGDRLRAMPAKRSKRLLVLDRVAQLFEPGVSYPEREVSERLRTVHPDYAMVRRYLVDEGFLAREFGFYWRVGGSFEPGAPDGEP